jgi:hypothetical protein
VAELNLRVLLPQLVKVLLVLFHPLCTFALRVLANGAVTAGFGSVGTYFQYDFG